MAQIKFFRKNHLDLNRPNASITITDLIALNNGQNSVSQLRNRNNITGWLTTGSTDAANTIILSEFGDLLNVDHIQMIKHNFKNYLIEWLDVFDVWNEYENITNNTIETTIHSKDTPVQTRAIRITIYNTFVADTDKEMRQLIITEFLYQFEGYPVLNNPLLSRSRKENKMGSGKSNITKTIPTFSVELQVTVTSIENDLRIHQNLYERKEGVLMLITGGDESQFRSNRANYRNEDIVLVLPSDEYQNKFYKGVTSNGIQMKIKLTEVDR